MAVVTFKATFITCLVIWYFWFNKSYFEVKSSNDQNCVQVELKKKNANVRTDSSP